MRTVSLRLADLQRSVIPIGFEDENLHTQVRIDCKKLFEEYPTALPSLAVVPPKGTAYPAIVTKDGDYVVWDVTASDTAVEGTGEIQLTFVTGEEVSKSYVGKVHVMKSIRSSGTAPDPIQNWITIANVVLDSVAHAVESALHAPIIDDNGYWNVWDADEEEYVPTEYKAEGKDGLDGVGITSIEKTGTSGLVDTYTVTFTNGTSMTFTVTNGEDGTDGISPTATVTKSGKIATITITDKNGTTSVQLSDGEDADPTELIDDTSTGAGKTWSAQKLDAEKQSLLTAMNSKISEPETEGTYGQMLTTDGHGGRTWTTPSGTGTVDSSMSTSSTNPVQNKVITHANNVLNDRDVFINKALESGSAVYDLTYTNRAINSSTGEQGTTEHLNRASTPDVYIVPDGCVVKISGYNNSSQSFSVYCFDEGMNLLGGAYSAKSDGTVNLKTNTKFMRFSMVNTNDSNITPAEAKSYATYTCYYVGRVATAEKDIDDLQAAVTPIVVNQNLILGKQWNDGYYNGNPQSSNSYKYVAGIPVESGKTYKVYPRSRMIYIMNAAGSEVNHISADNTTSITAAGDGFAYVTYYTADDLTGALFYEENAKYEYPEGTYALGEKIMSSVLRGKKWAVLGDSFTAGEDSGTIASGIYKGQKIVYPYLIGNRTGVKVLSFFQSGRTLAYPADGTFHNSVTDPNQEYYYQNIPSDVDYITIYLGINDGNKASASSGNIPLGTATDNTTATYYGAWNVVLSWLRENRPFAHIGIIVSNGCLNEDYRNAMIAMAKKYGVPYIDLNGDERTPAMIRPQNSDIPSAIKTIILNAQAVNVAGNNTHPNNAAHQFESTFIEQFLCSL